MLKKRWLAVVAICLSIFLILALVKFFQIRAAIAFGESFPEPSETVEFQSISYSTWQPQIKVSGEVRAPREVELRNEVAGVIAKIGFLSGASLNKGELMLQIDIAEEQAQLSALKPQIELAEKDFKRLSGIKNKQAVSQQLIDQARSQLGVVKGQAASINESISNKTIVAPFDGTIGLHDFEVGEFIAADMLISRLIGNTDELWVDFQLPQQHGKITVGQNITATAEELFEGPRIGQVAVVEPAFSRDTRSLGVRAVIANADQAITPGSFVTVSAPTGAEQIIIRVPSTAVRVNSFGSFVFLLEQQGQQFRAKRKSVTVLAKDRYQSILKADLSEGVVIATIGAYKLREGLLVNLSGKDATGFEVQEIDDPSNTGDLGNATELDNSGWSQQPRLSAEAIDQSSIQPTALVIEPSAIEIEPSAMRIEPSAIDASSSAEASTSE